MGSKPKTPKPPPPPPPPVTSTGADAAQDDLLARRQEKKRYNLQDTIIGGLSAPANPGAKSTLG